jgi:hypothetical protein
MIEKQKLELADSLMASLQGLDPDWRTDSRLQQHAKDLLCSTHIESRHTVKKIEHAQALDAQRGTVWRGKKCPHNKRAYRCTDKKCVRYRLERQSRRAEQDELENALYGRGAKMYGGTSPVKSTAWPQPSPYKTDIAKAKALMAEAGAAAGFETTLSFDLGGATVGEPLDTVGENDGTAVGAAVVGCAHTQTQVRTHTRTHRQVYTHRL